MDNPSSSRSAHRPTLARAVANMTLRGAGYPGRKWVGAIHRNKSRKAGGKRIPVTSVDGETLDAWHIPAVKQDADVPKLPMVMVHGWMEFKELHFGAAMRWANRGHDVVLYDHRCHGYSGGKATTFGVMERHDLKRVIDASVQQGIIDDNCMTVGFSLGAATVLQHAAIDDRVKGVVAMAPFADFRSAVESFRGRLVPWMDRTWLQRGFDDASSDLGFAMDDASTLDAVKNLTVPVLLVEGGNDKVLPPDDHVQRLAQVMDPSLFERLHVPKASHAGLCRKEWPEVEDAIEKLHQRLA